MKCPKCKGITELQKRQVGLDDYHEPVYNEFAICRSCKKQWNLDKIRAQKAEALEKRNLLEHSPLLVGSRSIVTRADSKKTSEGAAALHPTGYNDSSQIKKSTKPGTKTPGKSANKSRHRSLAETTYKSPREVSASAQSRQKRSNRRENPTKPALLPVRMAFCLMSLIGFGYWITQGFRAGLDSIEGIPSEYSSIYIILAICFLVAAVLWWLLRGKNAFYVYFLPMISYFIGAYVTFSHREEASHLLIATIASAIFGILCVLVVALAKMSQQ